MKSIDKSMVLPVRIELTNRNLLVYIAIKSQGSLVIY